MSGRYDNSPTSESTETDTTTEIKTRKVTTYSSKMDPLTQLSNAPPSTDLKVKIKEDFKEAIQIIETERNIIRAFKSVYSYLTGSSDFKNLDALLHSTRGNGVNPEAAYNQVINGMRQLLNYAKDIPKRGLTNIPVLLRGKEAIVAMTPIQNVTLFAAMALGAVEYQDQHFLPTISFDALYGSSMPTKVAIEKLKCIFAFFEVVDTTTVNMLAFARCIPQKFDFATSQLLIQPAQIKAFEHQTRDDLQFQNHSNKDMFCHVQYSGSSGELGKYVLGDFKAKQQPQGGEEEEEEEEATQEEPAEMPEEEESIIIRSEEIFFYQCPEMIPARCFMANMDDDESIVIQHQRWYNDISGGKTKLIFMNNTHNDLSKSMNGVIYRTTIHMDAVTFGGEGQELTFYDQYQEKWVLRELYKAYAGFAAQPNGNDLPLTMVTGLWGAMQFGDLELKVVIQILAASAAGKGLYVCCESRKDLFKGLSLLIDKLNHSSPLKPKPKITIQHFYETLLECTNKCYEQKQEFAIVEKFIPALFKEKPPASGPAESFQKI